MKRRNWCGVRVARAAIFLFIAALYILRLGYGSLWDNSEPTYGEIIKQMLRSGDWLTLHYSLQPWFIHPPLWFWLAAASAQIFGLNEFALRLPGAIFGLACVGATYFAGRRLYGETAALIAALALGTCIEFIVLSRMAILDTVLLFFMSMTFFWSFFAVRDGDRRAFWIAIVAAALGTLTKGPVAVVLPAIVLFAYCAWTHSWRRLRRQPWLGGIAAYAVLAGAWFAAETVVNGSQFLGAYFGLSTIGRYVAPLENQPGPWWYYVPIVILGFFPAIAFLPNALAQAWKTRGAGERFLLCYAAVPFIFFSAAQTKLPNYIAMIFPACAVLVGRTFGAAVAANDLRPLRTALVALPASLALLVIGMALYARAIFHGPVIAFEPSLALLGIIVALGAIAVFSIPVLTRRAWAAPAAMALMMGGFVATLVFAALPQVESLKPMKGMAAEVSSLRRAGDQIGFSHVKQGFSLLYYSDAGQIFSVDSEKGDVGAASFFDRRRRVLCVMSPQAYERFRLEGYRLRVMRRDGSLWLVTNK